MKNAKKWWAKLNELMLWYLPSGNRGDNRLLVDSTHTTNMSHRNELRWSARNWIEMPGKRVQSYRFFGYLGVASAFVMSFTLAAVCGLSLLVILALSAGAVLTFFGLVAITKLVSGEELIIYYHHEIGVTVIAALALKALGEPCLPYLDIVILGIGIFLAFGRLGCMMSGCCHGRPHRWGLTYREEHARDGFAPSLVGARLFPIQAVESFYVASVVVLGFLILIRQHQPGEAMAWYCATYGVGRFYLEFARGDSERPYYFGFSQAQWISVLQTGGFALAEACGELPFRRWHVAVAISLPITMVAIAFRRHLRRGVEFRLFHANHILEVARAVDLAVTLAADNPGHKPITPQVIRTSLGVQLSALKLKIDGQVIHHYGLSCSPQVDDGVARRLARMIVLLKHPCAHSEIVRASGDVIHLLVRQIANDPVFASPTSTDQEQKLSGVGDIGQVAVS